MTWHECTGRGVRVAVIDSGIHAGHPHVTGVAGGACIDLEGLPSSETGDRLGHGTAVAAAICEKAPDAALYAVKVFDRTLAASVGRIVAAIRWAADAGIDVINLSLGTDNVEHAARFAAALQYAADRGAVLVAAAESDGRAWLPGSLPGVIGVRLDWTCPRDDYRVAPDGAALLAAGYPRPIPGVPPEANLRGISFAVANISGFVARAREASPSASGAALVSILRRHRPHRSAVALETASESPGYD